jgi:two-component system copper resistance phosphate regulon response regulator CusR
MRVLIVEDDQEVVAALKQTLESNSYSVDVFSDGEEAIKQAEKVAYDLILLDFVLPDLDGTVVCSRLRHAGFTAPIFMLTVKQGTDDKVNALDTGVDDYLTKPFSTNELLARIRALLRRQPAVVDRRLSVGDLTLDTVKQTVMRGKSDIYLTRKEYALLEYLMRHADAVCGREALLEHVWDKTVDTQTNSLEMHVMTLRKKVDGTTRRKLLHTVPGRGYRLSTKA